MNVNLVLALSSNYSQITRLELFLTTIEVFSKLEEKRLKQNQKCKKPLIFWLIFVVMLKTVTCQ